jgi:sugar lactone lactonase YvrE
MRRLSAGLGLLLAVCATLVAAEGVKPQVLVPGGPLHAIEGMAFGPDGQLYGTSVYDRRIYRIDPHSGAVTYAVPAPFGEADDVAFGPAGSAAAGIMAWTAQRSGELRIRRPDGALHVALANVPRVNPVAFDDRGRLFVAQSRAGDNSLWEVDVIGRRAPRLVSRGQESLNGFDFGADGLLYAPAFGSDRLVAIDPDTGVHREVARGVGSPAAVKVDRRDGSLVSIDYLRGELWRTDLPTRRNTLLGRFDDVIDNVTLGPDGLIYLPSVADSRVLVFDPSTGHSRRLVDGHFTVALGAVLTQHAGREAMLVADPFGYRFVDLQSGAVTRPPWVGGRGMSSAIAASDTLIAFSYSGASRVRVIDRRTDAVVMDVNDLNAPRGLLITDDGAIVVAEANSGRLLRLHDKDRRTLAEGLAQPVALLADGQSSAIVSEYGRGALTRVSLKDGSRQVLATGFESPSALARLADGRIAVVEQTKRRLVLFDPRDGSRRTVATELPTSLANLPFAADTTTGLVATRDGRLYVTCAEDNSILRIDP